MLGKNEIEDKLKFETIGHAVAGFGDVSRNGIKLNHAHSVCMNFSAPFVDPLSILDRCCAPFVCSLFALVFSYCQTSNT